MKTKINPAIFLFTILCSAVLPSAVNDLKAVGDDGRREAFIYVKNETGVRAKFKLRHIYTGEDEQISPEIELAPGAEAQFMTAKYKVGGWTSGRDNWIVLITPYEDIRRPDLNYVFKAGNEYRSGTGFGANYKVHTLTNFDTGKNTTIHVKRNEFVFKSPSGESSTYWVVPGR